MYEVDRRYLLSALGSLTAAGLLPWGLGLAAGAMLFVICRDVIPEGHRSGDPSGVSCAVVAGFIVMMVLDTALS